MYLLYSILLGVGSLVLLPRIIRDALGGGEYVASLRERFGDLPYVDSAGRTVVWLHSVSVGETQAARPLVGAILKEHPSHVLVVSTTTLTGQRLAREAFRDEAAAVFYFPFDWAWTVRRALRRIKPHAVVIMETELWPNFLRECSRRRVKTALVNGRISGKSFRRYRLISRFISRVASNLDLALMQTEADAERIRALGLAQERVIVSGNVKFDASADAGEHALTVELRERFRLDNDGHLIVAASTHAPEERIVIEALKQLRSSEGAAHTRLIIAPRHPERFNEAASLLQSSGLKWTRRTSAPSADDAVCDAILLDTIGELRAVYPLASLVFVGGSIAPNGGHNVLEPASVGACIVTGAHTSNFAAIMHALLEACAIVQLPSLSVEDAPRQLAAALKQLLDDEERRLKIGARARAVLESNRGATERTLRYLETVLRAQDTRTEEALPQESAPKKALST